MIRFKNDVGNTLLRMRNFKIKTPNALDWTHFADSVEDALSHLMDKGDGVYFIYHPDWGNDKGSIHVKYDSKNKQWINGGHDGGKFEQ